MSRTRTRDRLADGSRIGDYQIEHELGFEEIGMVYLGRHRVLPRHAAIKVMHAHENWLRAKAVQMLKEACLVEALGHPGIPRVFECGVLPDKRPWTAFEYLEGESLGTILASVSLPMTEVMALVRDVADILDHIHQRGIVHRRISVDSIMRTPTRRFPVCIRLWSEARTLDAEGEISLDQKDDVHELGVVAYRGLTGALPDLAGHARDRFPGVPTEVAKLLDQMLAIEPDERPTSAEVRDRAKLLVGVLEQMASERNRRPGTRQSMQPVFPVNQPGPPGITAPPITHAAPAMPRSSPTPQPKGPDDPASTFSIKFGARPRRS